MTKKNIAVIISNLGSPNEATPQSLRHYLQEFLSDPYVVQIPRYLWLPILYGLILPFRSRSSAKLYQKIWTPQGSPLIQMTRTQAEALQNYFDQKNISIQVNWAMRYGAPSFEDAFSALANQNITDLVVFPLYPQYSRAATESTFAKARFVSKMQKSMPRLHFIEQYATDSNYIQALCKSMIEFWQKNPPAEKLLFSFHGLPLRSIKEGDPYYSLCHRTARAVANQLNLPDDQWLVVFQSRFGLEPWLQPYCDIMLESLAARGVKSVDIICPGFAADCLETLEEIKERNAEYFLKAGGKQLNYIPALNDRADHIEALANVLFKKLNLN